MITSIVDVCIIVVFCFCAAERPRWGRLPNAPINLKDKIEDYFRDRPLRLLEYLAVTLSAVNSVINGITSGSLDGILWGLAAPIILLGIVTNKLPSKLKEKPAIAGNTPA